MFKKIFYLLIVGLIVLIFGEILTRLFIPIDPFKHSIDHLYTHPYIRVHWAPGFKTTYNIEGIGGQHGEMHFEINPFGFRSSVMKTAEKAAGTKRIFFMGESTTECIYMPEEKTFTYLTGQALKTEYPYKKFETINTGMSGTLAADSLSLLIYQVLYYQPDVLIVMHAVNDLRYGVHPSFDPVNRPNYQRHLYDPKRKPSLGPWLTYQLKKSHFLTLIKWRLINRIFPPEAEKYKTVDEVYEHSREIRRSIPQTDAAPSKSLNDYLKSIRLIAATAKASGVRIIFMTEPSIYQDPLPKEIDNQLWMGVLGDKINLSNAYMRSEMERFNNGLRNLAKQENFELIDLERLVPKDLKHFYDDVHYTPEGSKLVAEIISQYLITTEPLH